MPRWWARGPLLIFVVNNVERECALPCNVRALKDEVIAQGRKHERAVAALKQHAGGIDPIKVRTPKAPSSIKNEKLLFINLERAE
jgi:hypothetical protein